MKKTLYIVVVLLAIFGVWFVFNNASNVKPTAPIETKNTNFTHPDASNATFEFEDGPITLKNGSNEENIVPGGELTQTTSLTNTIGYGDINGDGKDDAVVVLIQSGGGSGVFVYIAAYASSPLDYKGSNAIFVGDRINPKSISISKEGIITFNYLDRKANEPYASEPTVPVSKTYIYSQGKLIEKQ
jgi:hypothetical protein